MITKTLEEIKRATRRELEEFSREVNNSNILNFEVSYYILTVLKDKQYLELPVSNAVFRRLLNYILSLIKRNSLSIQSLEIKDINWLKESNIAGYCCYDYESTHVMFMTVEQIDILRKILLIWEEYPIKEEAFNNIQIYLDKVLPIEPLTEEERTLDIVKDYYIEENSGTTEISENTSRFSSAIWFERIQNKVIILAGLGGIGSMVCFLLARMQPISIFLYDDDGVEAANMSGQLFSRGDIGQSKVDAIAHMVENYANYNSIFAIKEKFTETSEPTDIMICGFDNMKARNVYFESWKKHVLLKNDEDKKYCLFIDGRIKC
jgi:Dinucleotide-utilizing enzymes involved in molybdopterin and thiamine biosynthesis family 1